MTTPPDDTSDFTRSYQTPEITVQWYAKRCIHSGNCVRSLHAVFDPQRRPWVDPTAASADAIAAAVQRCPSGALHYIRHDGGAAEAPNVTVTLTPIRNGPLYVRGDVEVCETDGRLLRRDTRMAICRCGLAGRMPFCDNTCHEQHWHEPENGVVYGGPNPSS